MRLFLKHTTVLFFISFFICFLKTNSLYARNWEISLNGGIDIYKLSKFDSKMYPSKIGLSFMGNMNIIKNFSAWQLGLDISVRNWKNTETVNSFSAILGSNQLEGERRIITGNPAYTFLLVGNRKWNSRKGYFYTGISLGMTYALGNGEIKTGSVSNTVSNSSGTTNSSMYYLNEINYFNSKGVTAGLQLGYHGFILKNLGYNIEFKPNYSDMKPVEVKRDVFNQTYDYDYKIWSFPLLIGLRYTF